MNIEKKEILKTFLEAKWAVGMPAIILGGIYSGFFTATEAAAVSVIYAIFVETVIYKNQSWGSFFQIIERGAISSSVIFIALKYSSFALRIWNEVATIILFSCVFLVVLKSTFDWIFGVVGIVGISILLMLGIKLYKNIRKKKTW